MKLKISDEELDQNYLDWLFPEDLVTNKVECDNSAKVSGYFKRRIDYETYILGFRAAESHHQSKVDKLMQIVEMQREALEHYEDTSYIKVDGVDSQGYEIENEYFIAADAMLETDKMLKELNDQK